MLVLSRRTNEKIVFPSIATRLQIVAIKAGVVRLGIDAPPSIPIYREELLGREGFLEASGPGVQQPDASARLHLLSQVVRDGVIGALGELARLRRQMETGTEVTSADLDRLDGELRRLEKLVAPRRES